MSSLVLRLQKLFQAPEDHLPFMLLEMRNFRGWSRYFENTEGWQGLELNMDPPLI